MTDVVLAFALCAAPLHAQLPAPPVAADAPLQWGGYGSIVLTRAEHPETSEGAEVSELAAALMAWGQLAPRATYLVEMDLATRTSDTWTGREADQTLTAVRLYAEYTASDMLRVRAGRFLTPIGQWNEAPAEPLTWTPTRPLATYRPFSKSMTGFLVGGRGSYGGHDVGYAAYWAPSGTLRGGLDEAEESSFRGALGARVAAELSADFAVGASVARARRSRPAEPDHSLDAVVSRFSGTNGAELRGVPDSEEGGREDDTTPRTILGADFRFDGAAAQLMGEGVWVPGEGQAGDEGGIMFLGSVRLAGPLWGVGRGEVYRPIDGRRAWVGYLGAALRRSPRLVIKAGYQFSRHPSSRIPDGWFLSFSSLF